MSWAKPWSDFISSSYVPFSWILPSCMNTTEFAPLTNCSWLVTRTLVLFLSTPIRHVLYTSLATCRDRQFSSQGYICPHQKGVVHFLCHLQGQTAVFSGIHLSPRRCCTLPLPPAGTDSCLLRDTFVPKKVLYISLATCRDRQPSSQGHICPHKAFANFWGAMLTTQAAAQLAARAEQGQKALTLHPQALSCGRCYLTCCRSCTHSQHQSCACVRCKRRCMPYALPLLSAMELSCFGTLSTFDSKANDSG